MQDHYACIYMFIWSGLFLFFFFFSIIIEANYKKKKEVQKNNITKTEGFITKNDLLSPFIHSYVAQLFLIPSKGLTEKS